MLDHDPLDDLDPPDLPRLAEWLLCVAAGKNRCDEIIGDLRRRLVEINDPYKRTRHCWFSLLGLVVCLVYSRAQALRFSPLNAVRYSFLAMFSLVSLPAIILVVTAFEMQREYFALREYATTKSSKRFSRKAVYPIYGSILLSIFAARREPPIR
jgi:hypothetical protein